MEYTVTSSVEIEGKIYQISELTQEELTQLFCIQPARAMGYKPIENQEDKSNM